MFLVDQYGQGSVTTIAWTLSRVESRYWAVIIMILMILFVVSVCIALATVVDVALLFFPPLLAANAKTHRSHIQEHLITSSVHSITLNYVVHKLSCSLCDARPIEWINTRRTYTQKWISFNEENRLNYSERTAHWAMERCEYSFSLFVWSMNERNFVGNPHSHELADISDMCIGTCA